MYMYTYTVHVYMYIQKLSGKGEATGQFTDGRQRQKNLLFCFVLFFSSRSLRSKRSRQLLVPLPSSQLTLNRPTGKEESISRLAVEAAALAVRHYMSCLLSPTGSMDREKDQ